MNRVVITGLGAVSPLGNTFEGSWEALKSGKSGIGLITKCDVSDIHWKSGGELKGFDALSYLTGKELNRLDPFIHYAAAASIMAVEDAGLLSGQFCTTLERRNGADRHQTPVDDYLSSGGVIIGSSRGGIGIIGKALLKKQDRGHGRPCCGRLSAYLMPASTIGMAPAFVAQKLGIKDYCLGISNACASGASAVGEAYRLIRTGFEGPVLAGGAEAPICRICIEGYGVSGALSQRAGPSASRPFARTRDGFVLSEGACIMVLENMQRALERGSKIYGEIIGYANTVDAFHQTRPDRNGLIKALSYAISSAALEPEDIDYINAHGSATPIGDRIESDAIEAVFKKRGCAIPVTAVKSMTGHLLAASGALEVACTVMSIKEAVIPPTINLEEKDPACNLNIIEEMTKAEIGTALSSSFGFGGINAVLVVRRYQ
jgi:3-oxoacyl-[acyl-carrier-protein] synthase II